MSEETKHLKQLVIENFIRNVKGKKSDTTTSNERHDGKEGHWLEEQMGIFHNASNTPDLYGFEMKNGTTSKTTFGDWSADYYIFKDPVYKITRDDFLKIFGKPNLKKGGRYSWSGEPCPKIGSYNTFGQKLEIELGNNIVVLYSYSEDKRSDKKGIVPLIMQKNNLVLAKWEASIMKIKVERKFNHRGWFQCKKDKNGVYSSIVFGEPINFENWIKCVKKGSIFFDSGMYQGNIRPYSQWRANNKYWEDLITSSY